MVRVFVLREQFKCRATEKATPAHDQQIYMLILKKKRRYDWLQDGFNKHRHFEVLKEAMHESHPSFFMQIVYEA